MEASAGQPVSSSPRSLLVIVPCTSSRCPHCGISRTAWMHPCRQRGRGSSFLLHKVSSGLPTNDARSPSSREAAAVCISILGLTWMLILELGQVVDIFIHDNEEIIGLVVRRYVSRREDLGHDGQRCCSDLYHGDVATRRTEKEARQADWERQLLNSCNVGSLVSGDPRPLHRVRKRELHGEKHLTYVVIPTLPIHALSHAAKNAPHKINCSRRAALAGHSYRLPSVMCDDCAFSSCFSLVRRLLLVLLLHVTSC